MRTARGSGARDTLAVTVVACMGIASLGGVVRAQDQDPEEPSPTRIERASMRYAHEPTVDALVGIARERFRRRIEALERAARRARRSGWAPALRLGARHTRRRDRRDQLGESLDLDRIDLGRDEDLRLEATATFRLDRVVYASAEASWARERRALERELERVTAKIVALYFERRRLLLERDLAGRWSVEAAARARELEALLDAFTFGEFSRMMNGERER